MKKLIFFGLFLAVIVGFISFALPGYLSIATIEEPIEIVIPQGASMSYVTNLFYDLELIKSKQWFNYQAKNSQVDRSIKPGTYTLMPNMTLEDIFDLLLKGNPDAPVILTIPEGWTLYQMAERAERLGFGTMEAFIAATENYYLEKNYSFDSEVLFYSLEGYLYPDTYYFTADQTVEDIVDRLAQAMETQFTDAYKERSEELGLTQHEVLTLASLIEREAYNEAEKATISGVIHNRLENGMLLQIDATVIYAIGEGKEHIDRVLFSHLETDNPFNTYVYMGLPPGPIAAPSKTSIEAALYPESHEFLYYVLGENGHVFGKTYEEHQKNVQDYRNIRNGN